MDDTRPPYVLVVEDDPGITAMLADLGTLGGFIAVCVSRALAAREIASALHPACCLVDMMLPDTSGTELARWLRLDPDAMSIPLIGMSASAEMAQAARDSGLFNAVIDKPFEISQLADLIAAQIAAHQSVTATTVPTDG